ncbi:unnamed protein product [Adineta ricciae]|uniref:VWFA domain-containing protein n=1 Tax=Adineta ricciae TaxID=249248 RepID=A0A814L716_ADIRI|nr:unnamed protein product [Adineta ricciae]CAF1237825.1 unnamed protein product [Adineta ricciae]
MRLVTNSILLICFTALFAQSTANSSFPVQLSIIQEKQFLPYEISTYTQHVNIEIKTGNHPGTQSKLPRELYIVLDSSGSMASADKWNNAISAIEHIIKSMNTNDKLHMIHYNSISSVVFENADNQQTMLNILHNLHPGGGTNLQAGFDQLMPLLKKYADRSTVKRVFILSDGQINEGVTDHNLLLKEITTIKNTYGVTICSFGIGYDFDEKLMTNIADYGSGDYFFIKGAESMERVVGIAYHGFQNLMGIDAYVKVISKYDTKITDVYGYEMTDKEEQIIPIGNLRYNDMMNILLETQVKITDELLTKSEIDYIIVELWMVDATDRLLKLVSTEKLHLSFSRDEKEFNKLNEIIQYLIELQKIQRQQEEITRLLRERRVDDAHQLLQSLLITMNTLEDKIALDTQTMHDDDERVSLMFVQSVVSAIKRRIMDVETSMTSESENIGDLAMLSGYTTKLSQKYTKSHLDL